MRKVCLVELVGLFAVCMSACSANVGDMPLDISKAEENSTVSSEITDETFGAEATNVVEETESTGEDSTADEGPVVLNIFSQAAPSYGIIGGAANQVVLEELNVIFNFIDVNVEKDYLETTNDVDIIVYLGKMDYEEHISDNANWTWDEELYDTCGGNIKKYMSDGVEYVSSLSGGRLCGFAEKNPYHEKLDGYGKIFTIAARSQNKEAAMKVLDWIVTPDALLLGMYGPKGVCWDVDEEGYYYLTETGYGLIVKGDFVDLGEKYGGRTRGWSNTWLNVNGGWTLDDVPVIPGSAHNETYDWRSWHLMQEYVE